MTARRLNPDDLAAGVAAAERAQIAAAFAGLSPDGLRSVASIVHVALRDEPDLPAEQLEARDWAARDVAARDHAAKLRRARALLEEAKQRGLVDAVLDAVNGRLRDEQNLNDAQEG